MLQQLLWFVLASKHWEGFQGQKSHAAFQKKTLLLGLPPSAKNEFYCKSMPFRLFLEPLSDFQLKHIHYKIWNQSTSNQYLISKCSKFYSKAIIRRAQKGYIAPKTSNWKRASKLSLCLPTVAFHGTAILKIAFSGTGLYLATGNPASASAGTESERRILHTPSEPLATQGQPGASKWHQMDWRWAVRYIKFLLLSYFWLFILNLSTASIQISEKLLHLLKFCLEVTIAI